MTRGDPQSSPPDEPNGTAGWHARRNRARQERIRSGTVRFDFLLGLLVATFLLSSFATGAWVTGLQIVLFAGVEWLAFGTIPIRRPVVRLVTTLVLVGSTIAIVLALTGPSAAGGGLADVWAAALLLLAVVIMIRVVLTADQTTMLSIYGAICSYMAIGLMFAALYGAMNKFSGGMFFAHGAPGNIGTFQYFSFTTLTTLGYGDFTAAASGGRAVAVLEAMIGQIFLATLVARLVASYHRTGQR